MRLLCVDFWVLVCFLLKVELKVELSAYLYFLLFVCSQIVRGIILKFLDYVDL